MTFYFDEIALMIEGTCPDCRDQEQSATSEIDGGIRFECSSCGTDTTVAERDVRRAMAATHAEGDEYTETET